MPIKYSALTMEGTRRTFTNKELVAGLRHVDDGAFSRAQRQGHYMVFGRQEGDDADSVRTYEATCEAAAVCAFASDLDGVSSGVPVYISYVVFTGEAIPAITTVNTGAY